MKKGTTTSDNGDEMKDLGEIQFPNASFGNYSSLIKQFKTEEFKAQNERIKSEKVNRALVKLIHDAPDHQFLLIPMLAFIEKINEEKIVDHFTFSSFELWLNQFSNLSFHDNYLIRSKIVGKYVPRDDYQLFFPIGMRKVYPGSHFVTAHGSPDLDTTIASFWGWVDAFGARVGEGLHIWNVPGGVPVSQAEIPLLFNQIFGPNVFDHLVKQRGSLALSSIDLMTQEGVIRKHIEESSLSLDPESSQKAIVLIDKRGYYLGDWRYSDVEGVRQVMVLLSSCLKWFETHLQTELISLFAKETLSKKEFSDFIKSIFTIKIKDCDPAQDFTEKQKEYVEDYLCKVLGVSKGLMSTFEEFALSMEGLTIFDFQEFIHLIGSLPKSSLFSSSGELVENRPKIFHYLEKIILGLRKAIQSVRNYVERLDVALEVKTQVFGYVPKVISYRADLEEIKSKMGNFPYLTVIYSDQKGRLIPIGVVRATDLYKPILGTVSLRDFCNREETRIPSYLEVISVIDHHRSTLHTSTPPLAMIADAQSSNTLVAQLTMSINDRYSTNGMTLEEIEAQMHSLEGNLHSLQNKRIYRRLLKRHMIAEKGSVYHISPQREYVEYLHFLFAILDDTDLLTKVTVRDIECMQSLLNRLKSLSLRQEVEIVSFDHLPRDETFLKQGASTILQNKDMYSLYRKIYASKEETIDKNLELCSVGQESSFFADTKELNGSSRVGQTKMFASNFKNFPKYANAVRDIWVKESMSFHKERSEVDLYLHMVTTLPGAEDLYSDTVEKYDHQDEIWIWVPTKGLAIAHLKSFLNAFSSLPELKEDPSLEVEYMGDNAQIFKQAFSESFIPIKEKDCSKGRHPLPIAILRFKAGSINSRKAKISPFLPKLVE